MLTVFQDPETIFQALAAGAHGYLVKPAMPKKLLEAIREIRAGGVPMSPGIAREVVDFFRREPAPAVQGSALEDARLGPREQQVLKYLVDGLSYTKKSPLNWASRPTPWEPTSSEFTRSSTSAVGAR